MKRVLTLSLLACTGLTPVSASAETMFDAVQLALENHPAIEAAEAEKKIAHYQKREDGADFYPEINTSATGGRIFGDNSTSRGLVTTRGEAYSYLWEGSASITQPLFNGFETFNRYDAAVSRIASAEFNILDVRENLAFRAVQAYLDILRSTQSLELLEDYLKTIRDYQSRIETMVDEGAADEAEAAQAKNIRLLLEDTLANAKGQVDGAYAAYREVTGQMPASEFVKPDEIIHLVPDNVEDAIEGAILSHPSVLASQKAIDAEDYEIGAEIGTMFPDLDGELSYLKRDQREEIGGESEDMRAVVRMNWTFSTGGEGFARVEKSRSEYSQALARSQETTRQVERDIRLAYAELETAEKQLGFIREREQITSDLFETYQQQFEGALVRLLQLMQAENQAFNTQLGLLDAEYRYLTAQYATLASMGQLNQALVLGAGPESNIEEAEVIIQDAEIIDHDNSADMMNQKINDAVYKLEDEVIKPKGLKTELIKDDVEEIKVLRPEATDNE